MLRRWAKQKEAMRILKVYQWDDLDNDQVLHELGVCADQLVDQLEQNQLEESYFCGSRPCALDALVFGHVATIMTTKLPNMALARVLINYPPLLAHCWRIDRSVFGGKILGNEPEVEVLE